MDAALARLAERDAAEGSSRGRTAMAHLNELALLLAQVARPAAAAEQRQGQGGQGTPQQQMQQMGQQQQQLNQQIQEMLGRTAGQRLSPGEGQRLRQMAEQQEALRRGLQQMIQQNGGQLGPGAQSALQRLQEQMGRAAAELRRGRLDAGAVAAPAADHRADAPGRAGRQRARPGGDARGRDRPARPAGPAAAAAAARPSCPPDRARADLLRLDASGYAPEMEALVRRYLQRLAGS